MSDWDVLRVVTSFIDGQSVDTRRIRSEGDDLRADDDFVARRLHKAYYVRRPGKDVSGSGDRNRVADDTAMLVGVILRGRGYVASQETHYVAETTCLLWEVPS